ncbi:MAG TPA: DUF4339 domain-containing protein [Verrucomicrobiae bacterium]|nr:DUF4339 domain-containing protein [Verrucomicrobiae bacterium]
MYHYNLNGQQLGPVTEEQLRQMVAAGQLNAATLIWREGMAEWQPIAAVIPGIAGTAVQCSVCKEMFPVDQTLQIGGQTVCAGCKPRYMQGLREGAVAAGKNEMLYKIALHQRRVLMCFLALLTFNIGQVALSAIIPMVAPLLMIGSLAAMIFGLFAVYRLAKALGYTAILYAIAMLIPCVNLLTLLVVISRATKVLKENGVKVGFLGVSKDTIEQLRTSS